MWAEAGRNLLAVGPWGLATVLSSLVLAILGVTWIFHLISKHHIDEGEVRIRPLGISVRWGKPPNNNTDEDMENESD
jgi:hypothetical protein